MVAYYIELELSRFSLAPTFDKVKIGEERGGPYLLLAA